MKKRTSFMEFLRTGKMHKEISAEELFDIEKKELDDLKRFENKTSMPKVEKFKDEVKPEPKEINTYWKLVILYNSGEVSEIKTTRPDSEHINGKEYFDPFLEWFMCSTNPYYSITHVVGMRIYVRREIAEINLVKFTTEEERRNERRC